MPDHEEKTVTNIAIRAIYDALGEIMGDKARQIIMRQAGLSRVIESPPDYTWDRGFSVAEQLTLYRETIYLVGAVGVQGVLRQMGYKSAELSVTRFNVLKSIEDLPEREKLAKAFEFFHLASNKGRVAHGENGLSAFDAFDCIFCEGIKSQKPYCSHFSGALQFLVDWSMGRGRFLVRETKCIATGGETCYFELEKR